MSSADTTRNVIITKEVIKRLIFDVKDLLKFPLDNEGIYYKHDEEDILKGYALIIGPKDSLYSGGYYLFTFSFPSNYPHSPPKVSFCTNDGATRFHPNMYKCGKVCLSVLNTWKGDQWTGCQSIRTILLTIVSIMDNNPLLHEPGFTKIHKDVVKFNQIIYFKNFDFTINRILTIDSGWEIIPFNDIFKEEMKFEFTKNKENILSILEEKKKEEPVVIKTGIYNMNISINWKNTYDKFLQLNK